MRLVQPRAFVLLGLALAAFLVSLLAFELVLAAVGFRYQIGPEWVEFGWPDPVELREHYVGDPDLFWVPKDYGMRMAALRSAPQAIVFMGDSTTEFGDYPGRLMRRLKARRPDLDLRWQKIGVSGWSSFQGRQQLERDVVALRPAVVTFNFGWNDHWIGYGVSDEVIHGVTSTIPSWSRGFRLTQLLFKGWLVGVAQRGENPPLRVSTDSFRGNLSQMVRIARDAGIVPVLITPPTSHRKGREPELIAERWLEDLSQLVPLHQRYLETVREVAEAEGCLLCDAAEAFRALPPERVYSIYFFADGIHLTPLGNAKLAELIEGCLTGDANAAAALFPGS